MTESIRVVCPNCEKQLKVPASHLGRKGKCPACQRSFLVQQRSSESKTEPPHPADTPKPPKKPLDKQPVMLDELSNDGRRFFQAVSIEQDKYAIVEPFLMSYEQPVAIAVQRQFPFSLFADVVLLTSHRLLVFHRFFSAIRMFDTNYVDLQDVKIEQGYFTARLTIHTINKPPHFVDRLVTNQALNVYRQCQDIETKARIARRQFQLEENRSKTTQMQINNLVADPRQRSNSDSSHFLPSPHDLSQIGAEERNPYKIGE